MMETASGFFGVHPGLPTYQSLGSVGGLVNGCHGGSSSVSAAQDTVSGGRRGGLFNGWNSYGPTSDASMPVASHPASGCNSFSPYSSSLQGAAATPVGLPKPSYSSFASGADLLSGCHPQLTSTPFGHTLNGINSLPAHMNLSNLYSDMYPTNPATVGMNNAAAAAHAASTRLFSSELASLPMPPRIDTNSLSYINDVSSQNAG